MNKIVLNCAFVFQETQFFCVVSYHYGQRGFLVPFLVVFTAPILQDCTFQTCSEISFLADTPTALINNYLSNKSISR